MREGRESEEVTVHHLPIEPTLDLHAFAPRDVKSVVEEYIREAHARVDGRAPRPWRGRGVQRGIVQSTLDAHPLVEAFWDDTEAHLGATFARLVTT